MFKVNNKNTRTTSLTSFWCIYCKLSTYFTHFSTVSFVDFEQAGVSWNNIRNSYDKRLLTFKRQPHKMIKHTQTTFLSLPSINFPAWFTLLQKSKNKTVRKARKKPEKAFTSWNFDKNFIYKTPKRHPAGKHFRSFFSPSYSKNCILKKFDPKTGTVRVFSPKSGNFFWLSKKGRGGLLSSPC